MSTAIATATMEKENSPYTTREDRWSAVVARDEGADGAFWFSVSTTGVYCYPSCPARRPRPEHVAFYDTREAAQAAGFRPCKRCRPDLPPRRERNAERVAKACRIIETSEQPPALAELAAQIGWSTYHLQRQFKQVTGMTPRQYAAAERAGRVRQQLRSGGSVTDAIYAAGYNSPSRFYERAGAMLGMSPTRYAQGGKGEVIRWRTGESRLGPILVAATARGVCAILFGEDTKSLVAALEKRFPNALLSEADEQDDMTGWIERVARLIESPSNSLDLPIDVIGTPFQKQVWEALAQIPPGKTVSYRDVAERIGRPRASRAVAAACGANPLAVAIPCHRVLASNGTIGGYRWGVKRKEALLRAEASSRE